jgi:hypothetical protein
MGIKSGVEQVPFFYHEIPGSPFHLAVEIPYEPISHKNRQRPFHALFLKILEGIGVIKKCLQPCLIPHENVHGGNEAHFLAVPGAASFRFLQEGSLGRLDVV